jgi:hypothetical protein
MAELFNIIILGAAGSLLAAGIVLLVSLLFKRGRYFLFYRVRSYELKYHTGVCDCQWDIQWEDLRFTIKVKDVHNDYLENVIVLRNTTQPEVPLGNVGVSYDFRKIEKWPLQLRVNSIIRARCLKNNETEYAVFLNIRRRIW